MDEIRTLQALRAAASGRAQRTTALRHIHLASRPFAVVAYHLAGDEGAPLAYMFGTAANASDARIVVVPEPRNRDLRFRALAEFGSALNAYLASAAHSDGIQLLFANDATANWLLGLVGSYTRHVQRNGSQPAPPSVAEAGKNLSALYDLMTVPGSTLVLRATNFLAYHFQTGQLSSEDLNLAAQLAWVNHSDDVPINVAVRRAESQPPAGPTTDPEWDAAFLEAHMRDWRASRRFPNPDARQQQLRERLETEMRTQLLPGWEDMWRAHTLLSEIPAASYIATRYLQDHAAWDSHTQRMQAGEAHFANRPDARHMAQKLIHHEHQAQVAQARSADADPLIRAYNAAQGNVVDGVVVALDLTARVGRNPRPELTIQPQIPCTLAPGTKIYLGGALQVHMVIGPARREPLDLIEVTVTKGANSSATRPLLPLVGEPFVAGILPLPLDPFIPLGSGVPWTHALPQTA